MQQLTHQEIQSVGGGHDGPHAHFFGLHFHEIIFPITLVTAAITLIYTTRPRLAIGTAITAGMAGIIGYKLFWSLEHPSDSQKTPTHNSIIQPIKCRVNNHGELQ